VVDSTRTTSTRHPDPTSEAELAVLAAVYAFILECYAKKKAAGNSGGEDDGKEENHVPVTTVIP
jgi:hypothetical protein